jgi:hypothetical protein
MTAATLELGTKRSWRCCHRTSVVRGEAENICSRRVFRLLTLNGHHRRGYRTDKDFMRYPLIISASVPIAVQAIPSVDIGSQRQGTHRSRVSEPSIPDRDYPYRIFCDQLTQVGVLSEIFGTFLAIRSATNRDKAGPTIRTSIKRAICCAITNPTSTLVDAAIMATESAPPGLVAR